MDLTIREMNISDISFVNETRNLCREYLHDTQSFTYEETHEWFIKQNPRWFILTNQNENVGYVRTDHWSDLSVEIGMDIHPFFQGRGLSKPFYRKFFEFLKVSEGMQSVTLIVRKDNTRAISLYKQLGFVTKSECDYKKLPSFWMEKIL